MPPGRLRPARAGRADARGRPAPGPGHRRVDDRAVAVRAQPALRLRRPVRLRGRLPHRRAPGRGALPRPGAARRAARPGRAARAARPRGAGRGRGRAAAAHPRAPGPRLRGRRRPAPTARAAVRRRGPGPLRRRARCASDALAALAQSRRAVEVRMAGEARWTAIEDIGRLRDGLGVAVPPGTPDAFTDPVDDPLADLVSRYARTHGPFTTDDVAARLGLGGGRRTPHAPAARRPGPGARRRVPARRLRARVVRRRGAPLAAPPVAGPAAQGGRAGPAGGARPVPRAPGSTSGASSAASTACSRSSTSSPAPRCRPAPSSRWCWPPGSATTSRPTSTSSPPPAR